MYKASFNLIQYHLFQTYFLGSSPDFGIDLMPSHTHQQNRLAAYSLSGFNFVCIQECVKFGKHFCGSTPLYGILRMNFGGPTFNVRYGRYSGTRYQPKCYTCHETQSPYQAGIPLPIQIWEFLQQTIDHNRLQCSIQTIRILRTFETNTQWNQHESFCWPYYQMTTQYPKRRGTCEATELHCI